MSWGDYEGCTIDELRERHGSAFTANERRGLDFSPPGGESPRAVAARLASFLHDMGDGSAPAVIVAHKGLLRASIVLACGWDMLGAPPVTIEDDVGLLHGLAADGRLSFLRSVPLLTPS
jgi:probable phosphoglycerate mutase